MFSALAPESGHRATESAYPFRANKKHHPFPAGCLQGSCAERSRDAGLQNCARRSPAAMQAKTANELISINSGPIGFQDASTQIISSVIIW
jgi:hypothetical protein